jgi:hypothetical protein
VTCHNNPEDRNLDLHRHETSDLRSTVRIAWPAATADGCDSMAHGVPCRAADVCPCWPGICNEFHVCRLRYFDAGWFRSRWTCLCSVDLRKVTSGLALLNGNDFQRHGKNERHNFRTWYTVLLPRSIHVQTIIDLSLLPFYLEFVFPEISVTRKYINLLFIFPNKLFLTLLGCGVGFVDFNWWYLCFFGYVKAQ